MKRTLNISFTTQALEILGGQDKSIVLVKESNEPSPISTASLAWFTTDPFQNVEISWEEDFYLYGSQTEFKADAIIKKTSATDNPLNDGNFLYQFGPSSATFTSVDYGGSAGTYYMKNLYEKGKYTLFGLAQKISDSTKTTVNPINAVKGIFQDNMAFTPVEKIRVFLQANVQDSKVLTSISSDPILLDFTGKSNHNIRYDEKNNRFVQG